MKLLKTEELSEKVQMRIEEIKKISKRADSKYYCYNVCAMLVDNEGNEFIGVNWEPANGATTCGEVGAISNYVLSERKPIEYVLTYGYPKNKSLREDTFCFPCGSCRQRLLEYVNENTICYGLNEPATFVKECKFDELLPYSFNLININN